MIIREQYLQKLISLKDKNIVKVVSGIRRCGKSTVLLQFKDYLLSTGVKESQIITINFDDIRNSFLLDYKVLYEYITSKVSPDVMNYIILDEVQEVDQFQKVINSLLFLENIDIYITGSNAHLLSGELATYLSGRYIEIKMLPLSFKEYYQYVGGDKRNAFNEYLFNGGFPYTLQLEDNTNKKDYLEDIYNAVIVKDIQYRRKSINGFLLKKLTMYLSDNVGNIVSTKKIADSLSSFGEKTSHTTIDNYLAALEESFFVYQAQRYDVKGKQLLKTLNKYYLSDLGFRKILLTNINSNIGYLLENIVYLELLRRNYNVYIGKVDDQEIDFIATNNNDVMYIQVSASVLDETTFAREIRPLKTLKNSYPKYLFTLDEIPVQEDGIKQVNIINFLLS